MLNPVKYPRALASSFLKLDKTLSAIIVNTTVVLEKRKSYFLSEGMRVRQIKNQVIHMHQLDSEVSFLSRFYVRKRQPTFSIFLTEFNRRLYKNNFQLRNAYIYIYFLSYPSLITGQRFKIQLIHILQVNKFRTPCQWFPGDNVLPCFIPAQQSNIVDILLTSWKMT